MSAARATRFEALLDAHAIQHDAAYLRARKVEGQELSQHQERYRREVSDRLAHRCPGCGAWLYSFRPCRTPGCC